MGHYWPPTLSCCHFFARFFHHRPPLLSFFYCVARCLPLLQHIFVIHHQLNVVGFRLRPYLSLMLNFCKAGKAVFAARQLVYPPSRRCYVMAHDLPYLIFSPMKLFMG